MIKTNNNNLKIADLNLDTNLLLAPMAGYTNLPFRLMCEKGGAKLTCTEMINSKALYYKDQKTQEMLNTTGQQNKVAVQIFGSDPYYMSEAAKILCDLNRFAIIDINMGCPAPKIIKNGDGSALMKDMLTAGKIVEAVKKASNVPVTVKMRKGIDETNVNVVEFAKYIQDSGADLVTVHGRTQKQYYTGTADLDIIKQVKDTLSIPVIANGDAFTPEKIKCILDYTGCDGVMVGRAAQNNPCIFCEYEQYIKTGQYKQTSDKDKVLNAIENYKLAIGLFGEDVGVRQMRKQLYCYLKSIKNSTAIKQELSTENSYQKVIDVLSEYADSLE